MRSREEVGWERRREGVRMREGKKWARREKDRTKGRKDERTIAV